MQPPQSLYRALVAAFEDASYTPPALPKVGMQAVKLTKKPTVDFAELAKTLEADPLLMGQVLKRVQSAFYSGGQHVTSLEQAIARIGLQTLRSLLWEVCFSMRMFNAKGFAPALKRVHQHSVTAAHATRSIGRHLDRVPEESFLCALLHDCGIAGALLVMAEKMPDRKAEDLEASWYEISQVHQLASARMARIWELPFEVQSTLGHHHDFVDPEQPSELEAIVCLADYIANRQGQTVTTDQVVDPETGEGRLAVDHVDLLAMASARDSLGLSQETVEDIIANPLGE